MRGKECRGRPHAGCGDGARNQSVSVCVQSRVYHRGYAVGRVISGPLSAAKCLRWFLDFDVSCML